MKFQIGRVIRLGLGVVAVAAVSVAMIAAPASASPAQVKVASESAAASSTVVKTVNAYTGCAVQSDARLWCGNVGGVDILSLPLFDPPSRYRDTLLSTYSWFDCWTTGELHSGGNYTWYHTQGDYYGRWGYVPAVDLYTPGWFDANPSAYGLRHC